MQRVGGVQATRHGHCAATDRPRPARGRPRCLPLLRLRRARRPCLLPEHARRPQHEELPALRVKGESSWIVVSSARYFNNIIMLWL